MKKILMAAMALLAMGQVSADFVQDYSEARKFFLRKPQEAQTRLETLLKEPLTPVQKNQVLSDLVFISCRLRKFDQAEKYISQITEKTMQKYNQLHLLNSQTVAKRRQLLAQFGNEDFSQWPENLAYLGYYERAYAYSLCSKPKEALADAENALKRCGSDQDVRLTMLALAGRSCQQLKDNEKAVKFYEEILKTSKAYGGSSYLSSALACARIYIDGKRFAEAEKILLPVRKTHPGYYSAAVYLTFGDLYAAQGNHKAAAEYYQKCISEKGAGTAAVKKSAEEKLKKLPH